MTDDEVIRRSKEIAEENSWPFKGEVSIVRAKMYHFFGKRIIRVKSNKGYRGVNVFLTFCAETGEVLHKGFGKR